MDKQLQALQHNLEAAIERATESCEASGHAASNHWGDATKMVETGKAHQDVAPHHDDN